MVVSFKQLELFRDLEIRKSEISEASNIDLFNSKTDTGNTIEVCHQHVIMLLNKVKTKEISEEHLLEWVNTVMFTDLFKYCEEYRDCIASVISELEEIDEEGKELSDEKIDKYISALVKNIEL
ncbi:hypothetical protein CLHUN_16200 [Ruminiclostridium hungatei]|uniref:Uncharacterized protein n=1 Tax=Ruminiclostridium hungatei TaxID=48256 RepID=A0A1V4SMA8_RUMHU|nr:hypothetical protein [Ruminiclostridium hungatei]OPX44626.1 hypothetical protein CLHUN_16200 [Ruminiclostridium hungatei]